MPTDMVEMMPPIGGLSSMGGLLADSLFGGSGGGSGGGNNVGSNGGGSGGNNVVSNGVPGSWYATASAEVNNFGYSAEGVRLPVPLGMMPSACVCCGQRGVEFDHGLCHTKDGNGTACQNCPDDPHTGLPANAFKRYNELSAARRKKQGL